jgi:hypothetical protein
MYGVLLLDCVFFVRLYLLMQYPKEFFMQILSIVILLDVLCCIAKAWILKLIL